MGKSCGQLLTWSCTVRPKSCNISDASPLMFAAYPFNFETPSKVRFIHSLHIFFKFASIHWHLHVYTSFMVYAICGNRSVDSIFLSLLFSYVIFWLYFIFCNSIFVRGFAVSLLVSIKQVTVWFKGCLNGQCFVQQFWLTRPACIHWPGIWCCIISHKFLTWTNNLICCLQTNNLAETLF